MFSSEGPWKMRDTLIAAFFILYMLVGYLIGPAYIWAYDVCVCV